MMWRRHKNLRLLIIMRFRSVCQYLKCTLRYAYDFAAILTLINQAGLAMSFLHSADLISKSWPIKRLEKEFELLEVQQYGGNESSAGFFNLTDISLLLETANSLT